MNVLPILQVQVQIPVAAPLPFSTTGIGYTCLSDTAEARYHSATIWLGLQLALNRSQQFIRGIVGQLIESPCEYPGFDELHNVIVPQCSMGETRNRERVPEAQTELLMAVYW